MRTFIFIETTEELNIAAFKEQLYIYDRLGTTMLVDNLCDEAATNDILDALDDVELENASYTINDEKLSFAQTANQLLSLENEEYVLFVTPYVKISPADIEAMLRVAEMSEHHCFVLPGGMPAARDGLRPDNIDAYSKYTVVDIPCVLVKARYAFNALLLEDRFTTMTGALKAWSVALSEYGYNTVRADNTVADNVTDMADPVVQQLDEAYVKMQFMGQLKNLEEKYRKCFETPLQHFSKELSNQKIDKLLYFVPTLSESFNGTSLHIVECLKGLLTVLPADIELTIFTNIKSAKFWNLYELIEKSAASKCSIVDEAGLTGTYDMAFVVYHLTEEKYHRLLFKHCLRYVCWPLDLIIARRNNISDSSVLLGLERLVTYADGIIYSSENAKQDFNVYFDYVPNMLKTLQSVVHIIPPVLSDKSCTEKPKFEKYYLIFGNMHYHKMLSQTLNAIGGMAEKFIVVGVPKEGFIADNIYGYPSGHLSDEFIAKLYRNCDALIFPSIYEGFGLPVVQALNAGKDVIAMDVEMNHELEALSPGFLGHIHYMPSLHTLPAILEDFEPLPFEKLNVYDRTWEDIGRACWNFINEVAEKPVDAERLWNRWKWFD